MYVKTSDKTSCEEAQYCITWPVDLNDEWRSSVLLCASGSLPLTQSVFPTFDSQVQEYLVCKQERERVCVFVFNYETKDLNIFYVTFVAPKTVCCASKKTGIL